MARRVATIVAALGFAATGGVAMAAGSDAAHPSAKPRTGGKRTHFAVSFTPPTTAGVSGNEDTRYFVSASTRSHSAPCASSATDTVTSATAGSRVHVKLRPRSASGKWCAGRFSGEIEEIVTTTGGCGVCPPPPHPTAERSAAIICPEVACPAAVVVRAQKVGTFSFRVRKHATRH